MKEGIKLIVEFINNLHDFLIIIFNEYGFNLTDKDLHFWIMGFIGIFIFFSVYVISKWLSKLRFGITGLSFLFTLTFMFVLVFAIEIQQAITSRGNMEFMRCIIGLWGFIVFFIVYICIAIIFLLSKMGYQKYSGRKENAFL